MAARNKANNSTGTYIFGILIFVVLAVAILFRSGIDPQQKGQILRVFCAAGAGLVGSFIGGKVALKTRQLPGWANIPITASGGFALFLIVFYGLGSGALPDEPKKSGTNQGSEANGQVAVAPKYDPLKEGEATAGAWFAAFKGRAWTLWSSSLTLLSIMITRFC